MCCGIACIFTCIFIGLGWLLLASLLLMVSWNTVVVALANVKKTKFWHALIIVLTIAVLFGPLCCGGACGGSWCGDSCASYSCCSDEPCSGACGDGCQEWKCDGKK